MDLPVDRDSKASADHRVRMAEMKRVVWMMAQSLYLPAEALGLVRDCLLHHRKRRRHRVEMRLDWFGEDLHRH